MNLIFNVFLRNPLYHTKNYRDHFGIFCGLILAIIDLNDKHNQGK